VFRDLWLGSSVLDAAGLAAQGYAVGPLPVFYHHGFFIE
jgi:hypothetical protein